MRTGGETSSGLDLMGVEPVYVLRSYNLSRRLTIGVFSATVGSTIFRVLEKWPDVPAIWDLLPFLVGAVLLIVLLVRPPGIAFTGDGVRLRSFLRFGPLVPWSEVAEVKVPGRWDDEPSIRLRLDGHLRRRSLRGMPEEDVQRLAQAFARR